METLAGQLLVAAVAIFTLLMLPVVSRTVGDVGDELSRELDGGRTGSDLTRYLTQRNLGHLG